jgi:hypothetical protein
VTEAEWTSCTNPTAMLKFLRGEGRERKLRLFACACCRDIWDLSPGDSCRNAVEASEGYADGRVRRKDLIEIRGRAKKKESDLAHWAVMAASRPDIVATWVAHLAADAKDRPGIHRSYAPTRKSSPQQCERLRDIFGPLPFRTLSIDPVVLAWNDGTVPKVARGIYEDGAFDQMPILADALEDAGCDKETVLEHCRGPVAHVRGCWVIDLLLGG